MTLVSAITESISVEDYVIDFEYDEADVEAGETFRITVTITNEDDIAHDNVVFSLDVNRPFDEIGDDTKSLGTIDVDESKTVSFRLEVDSDAIEDEYDLEFTIEDSVISESDEVIIAVESNTPELVIGTVRSVPTVITPGLDDVRLTLVVENIGEGTAESIRAKLILPEGMTPAGSFSDIARLGVIFQREKKVDS